MSIRPAEADPADVPLGGTRAQAMQRLQIGIGGVVIMVLMVGLASIIQDRAEMSDATAVAQAAPATERPLDPAKTDPLAEAGVVPDLPTDSEAAAAQAGEQTRPSGN